MSPDDDKNLEVLEAIFHDAAVTATENEKTGEAPPELDDAAKRLHDRVQVRLAEMQRNLAVPTKPREPILPRYLAMTRDALLAKLNELVAAGRLQVAHRNVSSLSDDDLRRLVQSTDPQQS